MKYINYLKSIIILLLVFSVQVLKANERMGQGRLFIGSTQVSPDEVNTEMNSQSIKKVDSITQYGVEITFPLNEFINYGLRYSHRLVSNDEVNSSSSTDYKLDLNQDVMAGVLRFIMYKNDYFHLDGVLGVGGSNTNYKIKTSTQDGELKKAGSPFATLYSTAGVSISLGKGKYFFTLEAGVDKQKVDGLDRSGTLNNNVNTIDLSGQYFVIGVMFDGIPVFTK